MAETTMPEWRAHPKQRAAVQDLDDDWRAAYKIDASNGALLVTEIRVVRATQHPDRPLSKRTLQRLDPAKAITVLQAAAENETSLEAQIKDALAAEPLRTGRRGRGDWWWSAIALLYIQQVRAGSAQPVRDVASAVGDGYGENYVRDALKRARGKGLMSTPGQGSSGGQLTDKGIHALIDRDDFGELAGLIHDDLVIRDFTEAETASLNAAILRRIELQPEPLLLERAED